MKAGVPRKTLVNPVIQEDARTTSTYFVNYSLKEMTMRHLRSSIPAN